MRCWPLIGPEQTTLDSDWLVSDEGSPLCHCDTIFISSHKIFLGPAFWTKSSLLNFLTHSKKGILSISLFATFFNQNHKYFLLTPIAPLHGVFACIKEATGLLFEWVNRGRGPGDGQQKSDTTGGIQFVWVWAKHPCWVVCAVCAGPRKYWLIHREEY